MESNKPIEIVVNDRLGKKVKIKCFSNDEIKDVKKLISANIGTKAEKLKLKYGTAFLKDNITLDDYEIKNGSGIELYYN